MDILTRHQVTVGGKSTASPIMFVPGYGENQDMWRYLTPYFDDYRTVRFAIIGQDRSALNAYPSGKYATLHGYATDLLDICHALQLTGVTLVGHSVGAMIGMLAANREPEVFTRLVLVGASPRFLNAPGYHGGFSRSDIDDLLDAIDSNYLGWSSQAVPLLLDAPERPDLAADLVHSFTRTNPRIAAQFARATFLSDHRRDVAAVRVPTLVVQCSADLMVPTTVGEYLHHHIAGSSFELINATGHYPHLSAPRQVVDAIRQFLSTDALGSLP